MQASVTQRLYAALAQDPDQEALVILGAAGEQRATRAELNAHACYSAQRLLANGIQPGDVILMLMEHAYESLPMFLGALYMGAVPMLLPYVTPQTSPAQQAERLAGLVRFFQPSAILTLKHLQEQLTALQLPTPILAWDFKEDDVAAAPAISLSDRGGEDLLYLLHTSGTTARPKAVMVSHRMLLGASIMLENRNLGAGDICVSVSPLNHVTGLVGVTITGFLSGIKNVILSPAAWVQQPARLLQAIHQYRGNFTILTNTGLNLCLRRIQPEEIAGIDLSCLRYIGIGSELTSAATLQAFAQRFAPYGLQSSALKVSYGCSEGYLVRPEWEAPWHADIVSMAGLMNDKQAMPVAANDPDARAIVRCGLKLANVTIEIRDEEDHALPERHLGEIVVRSPIMFSGYWRQPELTAAAVRDGWYYSGDLGYLVAGHLYVIGRVKDLIIVGGRNLLPDAVEEQAMAATPGLLRAAVAFGVRDEGMGTEQPVLVGEIAEPLDEAARSQAAQAIRARVRTLLGVALADLRFVDNGWSVRANSKLSRHANREKYLAEFGAARPAAPDTAEKAVQKTGSTLQRVTAIFEEILGQKVVGPEGNFFDLGGDSISALKLLLLVEEQFGRAVPSQFFQQPTVAQMVHLLEGNPPEVPPVTQLLAQEMAQEMAQQPATFHPQQAKFKRKWTTQRIRNALRKRLEEGAFHRSYGDGMRWLASWSGNPLVQKLLYPGEVKLFTRFWDEVHGATPPDAQELQRNVMGNILLQRLLSYFTFRRGDNPDRLGLYQDSPLLLLRELSQQLATPDNEQSRKLIEVHGRQFLEDALKAGRGVILLNYHTTTRFFGVNRLLGPEISQYALGNVTYQLIFHSLYGSASNELYMQLIPRLRSIATQNAREVLLQGGIVNVACDSIDSQRPTPVSICGRVYPLQNGFAELALATNAAILPTYTVLQLDGRLDQYVLPSFDLGSSGWSHEARVAHIVEQAGAFLARTWRHAPGTLEWVGFETHLHQPKSEG